MWHRVLAAIGGVILGASWAFLALMVITAIVITA